MPGVLKKGCALLNHLHSSNLQEEIQIRGQRYCSILVLKTRPSGFKTPASKMAQFKKILATWHKLELCWKNLSWENISIRLTVGKSIEHFLKNQKKGRIYLLYEYRYFVCTCLWFPLRPWGCNYLLLWATMWVLELNLGHLKQSLFLVIEPPLQTMHFLSCALFFFYLLFETGSLCSTNCPKTPSIDHAVPALNIKRSTCLCVWD